MKKETTNQKLDRIIKLLEQIRNYNMPSDLTVTNTDIKPVPVLTVNDGYHCHKCGAWAIIGKSHICNFNITC